MAELKPCPFCGVQPIIVHEFGFTLVKCNNFECWIVPSTSHYTDKETAFEAWNRRAEDGK